ncbi:MAG: hypothetical protein ABI605_23740 [Rhizobacter sp.]
MRRFRLWAKKKKEENKRTQTEEACDGIIALPPVGKARFHRPARTVIVFDQETA